MLNKGNIGVTAVLFYCIKNILEGKLQNDHLLKTCLFMNDVMDIRRQMSLKDSGTSSDYISENKIHFWLCVESFDSTQYMYFIY